jgi:multicomponent Na+:H+ antiporter subunit E
VAHLNQSDNPSTAGHMSLIRLVFSLGFWIRFTLFSVVWMLLTGWQPSSWGVGAVFVITASLLSLYLAPKHSQTEQRLIAPAKLLSFCCYFFIQSLRGGWDTAKLALTAKPKLSPGVIRYPMKLVNASQVFTFMQVLSLLPGTVSAELNGNELTIHVLDLNSLNRAEIDDCYRRVSELFGDVAQLSVNGSD